MADFEYAVDGNIGLMRFNRPERMNAITYDMLALIEEAVGEADRDDRVRAVVVTGEGRAFSAGRTCSRWQRRRRHAAAPRCWASSTTTPRPLRGRSR